MDTYNWNGKRVLVDLTAGVWENGHKLYTAYVEDGTIAYVEFNDLEPLSLPSKTYSFEFSGFEFTIIEQGGASIHDYVATARWIISQRFVRGSRRHGQQLFRQMGATAPQLWKTNQMMGAVEALIREFAQVQ